MSSSAVESVLDVALWFQDRARYENEHLQAQKLQRLLFVAQGQYAVQYYGRKLMPATFVAYEVGPQEPNIMRFFEFGPPNIPTLDPPAEVEEFLERLWRKFGHYSADKLGELARAHPAYKIAAKNGFGEEISFASIAKAASAKPKPEKKIKTADGRVVTRWMPPKK
ncbi:MAG: hypothetical protein VW333_12490 [Pseudomonadales bacterium]|jgi:uncharacterized phage-associated protein